MEEGMYLSTRFLSLSSNLVHSGSKQELVNDMFKGKNNCPRTTATTLRFLQYRNLRDKQQVFQKRETKTNEGDLTFTNIDDDAEIRDKPEGGQETNKVIKTCGQFRDGTCQYKLKHTWKEYPNNKYSVNL